MLNGKDMIHPLTHGSIKMMSQNTYKMTQK